MGTRLDGLNRWQAIAAGAATPAAFASARGVSIDVVYAAMRAGELPTCRPAGARRRLIVTTDERARLWRTPSAAQWIDALPVAAVAKRLHLSTWTLYAAIRAGKLKAHRPGGTGRLRIMPADAREWFAGNTALDLTACASSPRRN